MPTTYQIQELLFNYFNRRNRDKLAKLAEKDKAKIQVIAKELGIEVEAVKLDLQPPKRPENITCTRW